MQVATSHSAAIDIVVFLVTGALVVAMNKWMLTWLFVPVVALVMFIAVGLLVLRTPVMNNLCIWIGKLSAYIFVCHPIARFIINKYLLLRLDHMIVVMLIYVIMTFLISMIYEQLLVFFHKRI